MANLKIPSGSPSACGSISRCPTSVKFSLSSEVSTVIDIGRNTHGAFSANAVKLGEYVRDNTDEDATFLTGVHHLNPIASIAGRDIVCGPDLWLYYHGLDTTERKSEIYAFYADPANNTDTLKKYGVDYILVSSYERNDYDVDYEGLEAIADEVFSNREGRIYKVREGE